MSHFPGHGALSFAEFAWALTVELEVAICDLNLDRLQIETDHPTEWKGTPYVASGHNQRENPDDSWQEGNPGLRLSPPKLSIRL